MRFFYNEKELIKNPCVLKVDQWKLTLNTFFKNSGYPVYKSEELAFSPDKLMEHPLIKSGKFEMAEKGHRIQIKKDFENELFAGYPEVPVEEGMRAVGIDPMDVGHQRVKVFVEVKVVKM